MSAEDTIAAVSTAFGEGAIAVLRISGTRAVELADKVFRGNKPLGEQVPRMQCFGSIVAEDGATIDQVLATVFRAPASYTGEDLVEIGCHGGILVTRTIFQRLLKAGARAADPGEFTQRAFLNGKMDLTQAEAVMDLIQAQTDLALRAANQQLDGRIGQEIQSLREEMIGIIAHLEAYIDFPDEDIDPETGESLAKRMDVIIARMDALLKSAGQGRVLREGVRTVIYGRPNAGKSSLLNLLLGFDRAIVSEVAGTTRDTIEEVINIEGIPLKLVDTAGMRNAEDSVESEGMRRTVKELQDADLVLEVVDGSVPGEGLEAEIAASKRLRIFNKTDLGEDVSWGGDGGVRLSCTTEAGKESLIKAIVEAVIANAGSWGGNPVAINERHRAAIDEAHAYTLRAAEALRAEESAEFVAFELRSALEKVGEVVGKTDVEEILGEIFGSFCIGK